MHTPIAEISLSALKHNVQQIKRRAPNSKILAILKANAYGHGLTAIAQHLDTVVQAFGVARLDEAIALTQAKIHQPIVLLNGFFSTDDLAKAVALNLELVLHTKEQVQQVLALKTQRPISLWLKVNTGMNRLGLNTTEFYLSYQQLSSADHIQNPIKLMTHFACADDIENSVTQQQITKFMTLSASLQAEYCLANSAGIIGWPQSHQDWIRPGALLYGISPMLKQSATDLNLRPVMTLKSQLIAIQQLNTGDNVGYGMTWKAKQPTAIGIVAVGYGDGYPRHAKTGTPVWLNGRTVSLVGRVSMDMIAIELDTQYHDQVGDEVILWGKVLSADIIAHHADTISYELLCNIARRVTLCYENND